MFKKKKKKKTPLNIGGKSAQFKDLAGVCASLLTDAFVI